MDLNNPREVLWENLPSNGFSKQSNWYSPVDPMLSNN